MASQSIANFLALPATVLGNIGQLKSIESTKSLNEALKIFAENKIYALPVMNNGKYAGLITIKAVVHQLVNEFYRAAGVVGKASKDKENALQTHKFGEQELKSIHSHLDKTHIGDIIDIKPTVLLNDSATVQDVVTTLQTHDRVPIVDKSGNLTSIYSQSGVIKYVGHHLDILGPLADHEIGTVANFITKPVKIVSGSIRAIGALSIMVEENFSSLGFTNEDKDVEGVMSFKDIKAAIRDLNRLLVTVADYVNDIRRTDTENLLRDVVPTVNCSTSDTLKKVIGKLNAVGIHRLFIREKEEKSNHFIGIVTLSDVIKLLLRSK